MNQTVNANRLFLASCFALITTSMAFGIRAGVLTQLGVSFQLDNEQLGYVNQMAFLGFPIAMIIGGSIVIPHLRRAVEYWEELENQ